MSTRSRIGIQNADGTITGVYCHFDGYVDHHGPILVEAYDTPGKVRELLSYGSISILERTIGEKCDFREPSEGQCLFYGRDRGDAGTEADEFRHLADFLSASEEYNYLFAVKPGENIAGEPVWWVEQENGVRGKWVELVVAVKDLAARLI